MADRYIGRAEPRPPHDYDPPTEPLVFEPQPRRRRPVALVSGLIAGGFLLLLIGIMAGFAFRFGAGQNREAAPPAPAPATTKPASPAPSADGPRAVTEKFLGAVRAGDEPGMQRHLCAVLRNDGTDGPAASKKPDSGFSWLSFGTLVNFKIGEEKVNALGASVKVELTLPLVGASNLEVYLIREGGGWRVCGAGPA